MKIYVFDSWRWHWTETIKALRELGHEVQTGIYWGPELVEWADVAIFHPVDNNLKQASLKQEKPKDTFVLAEAVDIDIYSNHLGGINWDYVDHLAFMAKHMKEWAEAKVKLPDDLPRSILPGGIDLEHFRLRPTPRSGYNVAWIGRLWIAKNVFGALQVFNELLLQQPDKPWRLYLRGEKYHPTTWWQRQCETYIEANSLLAERIEFVPRVDDIATWLDDKDYLLQTSHKEAFGYVVAQAAAKGIRPVVQMTTGALDIWPEEWIFQTHSQAVDMLTTNYDPQEVRQVIVERYPLANRVSKLMEIIG